MHSQQNIKILAIVWTRFL